MISRKGNILIHQSKGQIGFYDLDKMWKPIFVPVSKDLGV